MILENTSETFNFRGVFDTFIYNVYFDTVKSVTKAVQVMQTNTALQISFFES